jgi:phosphohistidine phosphatase
MRVILFRHGPAGTRNASRWPDDARRPLTPAGEDKSRRAAAGLSHIERDVNRILTSPLERADRTARIVGAELGVECVEMLDALAPGGAHGKVVEALNARPHGETVVLVGHEPDLGRLAAHLLFKSDTPLPLKKAGACAIRFDGPVRAGAGTLVWLATPRLLGRVRRKKAAS